MTKILNGLTGLYLVLVITTAVIGFVFAAALLPFFAWVYFAPSPGWALLGMVITYPAYIYIGWPWLKKILNTMADLLQSIDKRFLHP